MTPIYAGVTRADYSIPDGKYPAILFQIVQIGSHYFCKRNKNGDVTSEWYSPQILLGFELPTLTYENQNGEVVSNIKSGTYFLSMNPARSGVVGLREIIDGLRGTAEYSEAELEQFDISSFLGKECTVELSGVESKGVVYQNITKVEPYAGEKLTALRAPILVTVEDFKNVDTLNLPDWIKGKIMDSQEYTELTAVPEHDPNTMPAQVVAEPKQVNLLEEEDEIRLEDVPF
jgi:hypothetical protein